MESSGSIDYYSVLSDNGKFRKHRLLLGIE